MGLATSVITTVGRKFARVVAAKTRAGSFFLLQYDRAPTPGGRYLSPVLIAGWSGKSVAERYGECPVSDMRGDRSSEGGRTGKKVGGERSHGSKVRDHLAVGRSLIPFPREEKNEKKERKKKQGQ